MPYKVVVRNGKHLVVNADTGRVLGKHDSRTKALAQLRAVYANTNGA